MRPEVVKRAFEESETKWIDADRVHAIAREIEAELQPPPPPPGDDGEDNDDDAPPPADDRPPPPIPPPPPPAINPKQAALVRIFTDAVSGLRGLTTKPAAYLSPTALPAGELEIAGNLLLRVARVKEPADERKQVAEACELLRKMLYRLGPEEGLRASRRRKTIFAELEEIEQFITEGLAAEKG